MFEGIPLHLLALWWASLVPSAALFFFYRDAPTAYRVVALGFAVSWFADGFTLAAHQGYIESVPWLVTHYYPALQFGLFAFAFGGHIVPAVLISIGILLPVTGGPESIIMGIGSVFVLTYVTIKPHPLARSMWLYCFVGSLLYLAIGVWPTQLVAYSFQAARVLAFGFFLGAAYGERRVREGAEVAGHIGIEPASRRVRHTG